MERYCHACGALLPVGSSANYCSCCIDEKGQLKSMNEVQWGIAEWFQHWQPNLDHATALQRAEHYLQAMPAWAK
ncbi:hypothetical protein KAH55_12805 [bacterium]|nr:hypothetical protein [bacterium]